MQKHGNLHQLFVRSQFFSVTFITFFLKYCKTMQAMLAAFITTNTSGIPPIKANPIGRMFSPLFTINLLEEDQIVKDLEDIECKLTYKLYHYCMCDCIYYNIISDLSKVSLHAFDCKILLSSLSNFKNFKMHP